MNLLDCRNALRVCLFSWMLAAAGFGCSDSGRKSSPSPTQPPQPLPNAPPSYGPPGSGGTKPPAELFPKK